MSDLFEMEAELFANNFVNLMGKKIILYGIGRRTATLVVKNKCFNFVGLMDRDQKNIGKEMYGLPIMSLEEAEEKGDIIIINAPQTYWEIIYRRIKNSKLPVYYLNGQKAVLRENFIDKNCVYWKESYEKMRERLWDYDGVTFDIFDTLIVRKVIRPQDVFEIMDFQLKKAGLIEETSNYIEMRNNAINNMQNKIYTFDELYSEMQALYHFSNEIIKRFQQIEIEIEKKLITARKIMVDLCNEIIDSGKIVYFISDMYFSKEILTELLESCGLKIASYQIIVSCELKCEKRDGELWKYFQQNIAGDKRFIHVGDDDLADVIMPKKYGVDSYYIMSVVTMLQHSAISECSSLVTDFKESVLVGTIVSEIFNDPFSLSKTKGQVYINDLNMWGYCVWGNIILTFIKWLITTCEEMNIKNLFFLARDGYLIKKDYEYYMNLMQNKKLPVGNYLYASRRVANITSIKNEEDFVEWLSFPYIGKFKDFLWDRFSAIVGNEDLHSQTLIQMPQNKEIIIPWLEPYFNQIERNLKEEGKCYRNYLESMCIDSNSAIVDIGFYGNIQYKLSKILNQKLNGLYFICYFGDDNECCHNNMMIPCFQSKDDVKAENVNLHRCLQVLESLFTAPYGMILSVDEGGNKICAKDGCNQQYFYKRNRINEGIQRYMKVIWDMEENLILSDIEEKNIFADDLFGILYKNCSLDEKMCEGFVWDDIIVQSRENPIFM